MATEINWNKRLENEYGKVSCKFPSEAAAVLATPVNEEMEPQKIYFNGTHYDVDWKSGEPLDKNLPQGYRVRNKKSNKEQAYSVIQSVVKKYHGSATLKVLSEEILYNLEKANVLRID